MSFDQLMHRWLGVPYRLHVSKHGNGRKQTIIMLHGIAGSGNDWAPIINHLKDRYSCITIDLLGFGKSPKPQWSAYSMNDHIRSLRNTIRRLNIKGGYILMGHSLGSLITVRYAKQFGNNISQTVLISPPVYPPIKQISSGRARLKTGFLLNIYQYIRSGDINKALFEKICRAFKIPLSITSDRETWIPFMRSLKNCIEQQSVIDDIKHIHIPVRVLRGKLDQLVIGDNVEMLVSNPNVTIYNLVANHNITDQYGKKIREILPS